MNESALVADGAIGADEDIVGNSLPENLYLKDIGDDLLGFAVDIGVDKSDVVVASNDVAQGRKTLFDPLDGHLVGKRIANVLQLLVGGGTGHEETVPVASGETSNNPRSSNGSVHDRNDVRQFALKDAVKVLGATDGNEAVRVCQLGEDSNVVAVFELSTCSNRRVGWTSC